MTSNLELNCVTNRSMFIKHTDNWSVILNLNSIMERTLIYFIGSYVDRTGQTDRLAILNLKSVNWNLILFWNPDQKWSCFAAFANGLTILKLNYVMEVTDLFPWSSSWLHRLNRPVILNLKLVNRNLMLFWTPNQIWF